MLTKEIEEGKKMELLERIHHEEEVKDIVKSKVDAHKDEIERIRLRHKEKSDNRCKKFDNKLI